MRQVRNMLLVVVIVIIAVAFHGLYSGAYSLWIALFARVDTETAAYLVAVAEKGVQLLDGAKSQTELQVKIIGEDLQRRRERLAGYQAELETRKPDTDGVRCAGPGIDPYPPSTVCTTLLRGLVRSLPFDITQSEEDLTKARNRLDQASHRREEYDKIKDAMSSLPRKNVDAISLMAIAVAAGLLGSFLRYLMRLSSDRDADRSDQMPDGMQFRRMNRIEIIVVGPLLGIGAFWLLESNFLIPLLYKGTGDSLQHATVTWEGVGITSGLAGLWGGRSTRSCSQLDQPIEAAHQSHFRGDARWAARWTRTRGLRGDDHGEVYRTMQNSRIV